MDKFIMDNLHINVWYPGEEFKREYACDVSEKQNMLINLSRAKQRGRILDFEMYGFSAYTNKDEAVERGDKVYIKRAITQQKLIKEKMEECA